jgi:hypothetical protein
MAKRKQHTEQNQTRKSTKISHASLYRQDIQSYKRNGLFACLASTVIQAKISEIVNIIGQFLNFIVNENSLDLFLTSLNPSAWSMTTDHVSSCGYVPLHYHPFILKHAVLAETNYLNCVQLTNVRELHTRLEGCYVRAEGSCSVPFYCEQRNDYNQSQVRSMLVCSVSDEYHNNGGPQFLQHFDLYHELIMKFFHNTDGIVPVNFVDGWFSHNITSSELRTLNTFISIYSSLYHQTDETSMEFAGKINLIVDDHIRLLYSLAFKVFMEDSIMVPTQSLPIKWCTPGLVSGAWVYWNRRTPIRWSSNTTKVPFIAVECSLLHVKNGKLNASFERCILKEFQTTRMNPRRSGNTVDEGQEAEWVQTKLVKYSNDDCTINSQYNLPYLSSLQQTLLGVNIIEEQPARY